MRKALSSVWLLLFGITIAVSSNVPSLAAGTGPATAPIGALDSTERAQLTRDLFDSGSTDTYRHALARLTELGAKANELIPMLAPRARDQKDRNRKHAVSALRAIHTPETLSALAEAAAVPDTFGNEAMSGINDLGPAALETLVKMSRDQSLFVREEAAQALGLQGPAALPALKQMLQDPQGAVRSSAKNAIILATSQSAPLLKTYWSSSAEFQGTSSGNVIARQGIKSLAVVLTLTGDADSKVRRFAVQTAAQITLNPSTKDAPAITSLLASHRRELTIASSDADIRTSTGAQELLRKAGADRGAAAAGGPDDADPNAQLRALGLDDPDPKARLRAIANVVRVGAVTSAPSLELLVKNDPDASVRTAAAIAVLQLPLPDRQQKLDAALLDPNLQVRQFAVNQVVTTPEGNRLLLHIAATATNSGDRVFASRWLGAQALLPAVDAINSGDTQLRPASLRVIARWYFNNVTYPEPQATEIAKATQRITLMLSDSSPEIRSLAAAVLARLGSKATGGLIDVLQTGSLEARRAAAESLAELDHTPVPPEAVERLRTAAHDPDRWLRSYAVEALRHAEKPGETALFGLTADPAPPTRTAAMTQMALLGSAQANAMLESGAKDSDAHVRLTAMLSLDQFRANEALMKLHRTRAAVTPTSQPTFAGTVTISQLTDMLSDDQYLPQTQSLAAARLGTAGSAGSQGVASLTRAASNPNDRLLRVAAIEALGKIGESAASAVPVLVSAANDPVVQVGQEALRSLGEIGPAAKDAVPVAAGIWNDPNQSDLHEYAELALVGIGAPSLPSLVAALEGPPPHSYNVARALARIGPTAAPALPVMVKLLQSDDPAMQQSIITALGDLGPAAAPACDEVMPALLRSAINPKGDILSREQAYHAIEMLGCSSQQTIDGLCKGLTDNRDGWQAAHALGLLGPKAKAATQALIAAIRPAMADRSGFGFAQDTVGYEAVVSLGRIGPEAKDALPILRDVQAQHFQGYIVDAVQRAINQISAGKDPHSPSATDNGGK